MTRTETAAAVLPSADLLAAEAAAGPSRSVYRCLMDVIELLPRLRFILWMPKTYATRRYSWMTPPTRSCRRTRK
jgi:hypothetical protein